MRPLLALFFCGTVLLAQAPPNRYYISASTTKLTIQQPAAGSGNQVQFGIITVYCAADQTVTEEWSGAAATATAGTIKKSLGTFQNPLATAWTGSNVGSGTTGPAYSVPAGQTLILNAVNVRMGPGGTGVNYSIGTTGACTITIPWSEGIPVYPLESSAAGATPVGYFGGTAGAITGSVTGTKSNNAATPGATNFGVLGCIANAAAPSWTETFLVACSADLAGNQRVMPAGASTAIGDAVASPVNIPTAGGAAAYQPVIGYGFNGTSYDRLRSGAAADTTSGQLNNTGIQKIQITGQDATGTVRPLNTQNALADGNGGNNFISFGQYLFNGNTTYDRARSADLSSYNPATTTTAINSIGAQLNEKGSRWTVVSAPAADSQASASITNESAVRHVLDTVCFSATSNGAVAATNGTVNIRDGATGAGTVIAQFRVAIQVAAGTGIQIVPPFCVQNLNLVGTTNTAMTAEFSAGVTGATQAVTMTGFNVN